MIESGHRSEFTGYGSRRESASVTGLLDENGQVLDQAEAGQKVRMLTDRTPFYAESGGQVGDTGSFSSGGVSVEILDTIKLAGVYYAHVAKVVEGTLKTGQEVSAAIDAERRQSIVLHHSATHLMHAALRDVLGDHVQQKGSLVAPDRLRFDFSHYEPVSDEQLAEIEDIVNMINDMGITVHEHIIIGDNCYYSFADQGHIARMSREFDTQIK